ncbi:L-serine ammonia-lyase [Corynebacterium confusum]|uniref:L-serine ammonia-lyase n=1 Tax=Corynebacterium confusum TaxID=71254 RepID=UPI0025B35367|nr:L-serine ammonia-lyase [Corynebacterium confusum]WJY89377.1 L-serine dehydratase 1 [Corynebacterium confusum]
MFVSIFEMFKIGIGPSSSHTLGPMKAGRQFVDELERAEIIDRVDRIHAEVYGSLSLTGKGHATDDAIIMGVAGNEPETVDIDEMPVFLSKVRATNKLEIGSAQRMVDFDDIVFRSDFHPAHENTMSLTAYNGDEVIMEKFYCSIGGGFIVEAEEVGGACAPHQPVPYAYPTAAALLDLCRRHDLSIPELAMANEIEAHGEEAVREHMAKVWDVMKEGIQRGITTEGTLPGKLHVPRRAAVLYKRLTEKPNGGNDPLSAMSWLNVYGLAVNEVNASGGRVVTAPTNGACGIVPAVLAYYDKFVAPVDEDTYRDYFLTCTQVGALFKMNASISGAEVGCQGEVGVACSMAAAGLAQLMGGTPEQVCAAAEIGMEHNLGLTCDPVCGQVQVPCIERNAVGAVKAVNAARMALERESDPTVSLDNVIETMYQTGKDMNSKYRETSEGGLATVLFPRLLPCS